jgi:hypothetical protein
LTKIMITMTNGFGWSGCMQEKSASRADKQSTD